MGGAKPCFIKYPEVPVGSSPSNHSETKSLNGENPRAADLRVIIHFARSGSARAAAYQVSGGHHNVEELSRDAARDLDSCVSGGRCEALSGGGTRCG